jgi:hypothetical protein
MIGVNELGGVLLEPAALRVMAPRKASMIIGLA